jgi:hypothetical protein
MGYYGKMAKMAEKIDFPMTWRIGYGKNFDDGYGAKSHCPIS